tara:strand:- start:132562 stop:135372 length:2811 start_codon:yes stop_codon:yes gene_type:complete
MKENKYIHVNKARVHNLKSVSVTIPKNSLTVITGPSGSGKSSLAFDTIYVEGQRRYIESLSSYARQFLGQHQPPDVESITGLSPSIAIDQKSTSKNPRSTVGTITEIYDYLRVLFARVGKLHDPETNEVISKHTPTQIVKEILSLPEKTKIHVLSPIKDVDNYKKIITKYLSQGYTRIAIDGVVHNLDEDIKFKKGQEYELAVVIDRLAIRKDINKRMSDSVEHALKLSDGHVHILANDKLLKFSEHFINPNTNEVFPDLEPRLFSFNSPLGACGKCNGIGQSKNFSLVEVIGDQSLPVLKGAILPLTKKNNFLFKMVECILEEEGVSKKTSFEDLPKKIKDILLNGSPKKYDYVFKSENSHFQFSKPFPGILKWLDKKYSETTSERVRKSLEDFMKIERCSLCEGKRLNRYALATKIGKYNIIDLCDLSIEEAHKVFSKKLLKGQDLVIGEKLLKEIYNRLNFLVDVGLTYLTLNRSAATLSGGESQRIRLATQIGSALSGVLYVLDEPSIGLHQKDNTKLIKTMKSLRDIGNTIVVVEHDEETMLESDYIIDMGPGAGHFGGEVVASDVTKKFLSSKKSITADYLKKKESIPVPEFRRTNDEIISLKGASHNNLKKVDLEIPLGILSCITGVSGSGKSTLIHEVLVPACKYHLTRTDKNLYYRDNYKSISGLDPIKSIIELDQSPIGRTPNSNPATYSGVFDEIRKLFSLTTESQIRGYKVGRFSFNVKGGRCEECEGNGVKKIEMHFLPDVYIKCTECNGRRYNNETLSVLYKGKNIAEILELEISDAYEFFKHHGKIGRILKTLNDVGLGYMKLGQPATTLSGGEAQRLKLSRELAKKTKGHCLYVLDEPTTGLHFKDVQILLRAIDHLVEQGNTVVVIEHNLDVIKSSDYIVDLGPDGGDKGGTIVDFGTPEKISKNKKSHTGHYLKKVLN